jgi:predicted DNA-binding helix-hairpin-helix protein
VDVLNKLSLLSNEMALEPAEESGLTPNIQTCRGVVIYKAQLPNGKSMNLLKTLLTSACENNCLYCPFRAGRDIHRETFRPDEFAQLVSDLYHAGLIQGIFLSSGVINGGLHTQDMIIQSAEILRFKLNYKDIFT